MKNIPRKILKLAEIVQENNGRALLVGGCVRDFLMNREPKDFDVEVYGVEPQKLKEILKTFGRVDAVGESFTVYKIGQDLDVSLPRRERKVARGHKGFVVEGDPAMSFEEACRRRDFTINAILQDPLNSEIIDPFDGQSDIKRKLIRVVAPETFVEDSLRVLRAAQFAARFEFEIEPETVALCQSIDLSDLPKERIWGEFEKLLMKSAKPAIGLRWFYELRIAEKLFPELQNLVGVPQQSEWHPEGWVFSALPPESFVTSVTEASGINRSLLSLRQFVAGSPASAATVPTSDGAMNAKTFDAVFADFHSADSARAGNVLPPSEARPAISAEAESLVWSFGAPAAFADEVVRVVFKISLNRMRSIVFSAVNDFEIVKGIVQPVAVFVMNMLVTSQLAPQIQLHQQPVNSDGSVFSLPTGVSVSAVVVDARTSAVDNNVFAYFDLSFVGNIEFVHRVKNAFSSNCFEVELGDVAYHTLLVVNEARKYVDDLPYAKAVAVMLGALCHDFGKSATTKFFDGAWRAHGHDEAGVAPTESFLDKLGVRTLDGYDVRKQVVALVRNHMRPGEFYSKRDEVSDGAIRRLAQKVEPDLLARVARADNLSRNGDWLPREKWFKPDATDWFLAKVKELAVEVEAPKPILLGRHLLELGLQPSPQIGAIAKAVYELQLDGRVRNLNEAIAAAHEIIARES